MGPNTGICGGRRQEKVEETHEAGRQLGRQLLSKHAKTPLWLWTKCRNESREACRAEGGDGNMLIFLRKCKLGNITAEETEKKTQQKLLTTEKKKTMKVSNRLLI